MFKRTERTSRGLGSSRQRASRRSASKHSVWALLFAGAILGAISLTGTHHAIEATSSTDFCVSCHEMRANAYAEAEGSVHRFNPAGVAAECADCHIPRAFGPKLVRKVQSIREVYGHFVTGVIDTPEKYSEHRLNMATQVWRVMKRTDSRECRECHDVELMEFSGQDAGASSAHRTELRMGRTCIDCHQGIAHDLPEDWAQAYREATQP